MKTKWSYRVNSWRNREQECFRWGDLRKLSEHFDKIIFKRFCHPYALEDIWVASRRIFSPFWKASYSGRTLLTSDWAIQIEQWSLSQSEETHRYNFCKVVTCVSEYVSFGPVNTSWVLSKLRFFLGIIFTWRQSRSVRVLWLRSCFHLFGNKLLFGECCFMHTINPMGWWNLEFACWKMKKKWLQMKIDEHDVTVVLFFWGLYILLNVWKATQWVHLLGIWHNA